MSVFTTISKDLYRYTGGGGKIFRTFLVNPGFKYMVYFRLIQSLKSKKSFYPILLLLKLKLLLMQRHYGIQIPSSVKIGEGFYIGHFGTIVVNSSAVIGKNVNISQGVTIGRSNRGKSQGTPIIGNEVYIAPGAKIIGGIRIGNNVAIGANAVVVDDVPDNACVAGVPAKIVSMKGADGYVNRKI